MFSAEVAADIPWILENIWLVPAIPAASFLLILLFGKKTPGGGHWIGISSVLAVFMIACWSAVAWIGYVDDSHGGEAEAEHAAVVEELAVGDTLTLAASEESAEGEAHVVEAKPGPILTERVWFSSAPFNDFKIGTLVDGQSVMLLFVVTFISSLVHIFSTDYVAGDRRYTHYFAFLSLFTASMLFMVLFEQHPAAHRRLGAGWRLFVCVDRSLVGRETKLRCRTEGLPDQPCRRHRPSRWRDRAVLCCGRHLRHHHDQHDGRQR